MEPDVRTIADLPFHVMGRFQTAPMVGSARGGELQSVTGKAFFDGIRETSLGLTALGMAAGERVAIMSESRPEWLTVDLAVIAGGAIPVPIYPTLSASQVRYILEDSAAIIAVVSTRPQLEKIQEIRHQLPALQAVVVIDAAAAGQTPSVIALADVAARGDAQLQSEWGAARKFQESIRAVRPEQLATIIYTSGTTGQPKGVMLTHAALVANLMAAARVLELSQEDVALSFLPLSHAFERMSAWVYLLCGVHIVFAESFDTVGRDIALVKPTVLTGVPRVYEKLQARILSKGASGSSATAAIFTWAIAAGERRARAVLRGRRPSLLDRWQARLADRLVFGKVREALGGRVRYLVSGSAPLAADVAEFFCAVGLPIVEGYGLTETAPILSVNPPGAPRAGSAGRALPGVELRIAADGEILARGPNLMTGYYHQPEATADVLRDGWFHTGDIGAIDADGYLSITDRKKDLLVTSGGKKIAPQPIEATLKRSPLISEAVVLGERRNFVAALIVPDFAALEKRLQSLGRPPAPGESLIAREDVQSLYQELVDALNPTLAQFERIKRIKLLPREFTIDSGELTPTLKVKRKVVEQQWRAEIEALYREG
ncbi:MAG: long-chain fatty acid--CoA ligase [Vicinamibacterales bacterium]